MKVKWFAGRLQFWRIFRWFNSGSMTIHPPTIHTVHFWGSLNNSQRETADSSSFASSAAMTVVYSKWECLFFILEHRENATWRSFAAALCVYMASTQKAPHHPKGGRQETHLVIYSAEEVSRKATYISTRTQKCTAHRVKCAFRAWRVSSTEYGGIWI